MTRPVDSPVLHPPALLCKATYWTATFIAILCFAALSTGCGEDPNSPVGEAEQAQEDLEEAREEAAELLSEAEEEAVDIIADAKEKAEDEISDAKSEADQLIGDAQRKLDAKIDRLQTVPTPSPSTPPTSEPASSEPASSTSEVDAVSPSSGT